MEKMKEDFRVFIEDMNIAAKNMDDPHYFQLPIAGREDPIFRERVYCYELYHQIRNALGDGFRYKLDGEVDKTGHPLIPGDKKPDFILHIPGDMEGNLAVIEVKPVTVTETALEDDLRKLEWLLVKGQYHWGIMLIYGDGQRNLPEEIQARVLSYSKTCDGRILLVWHSGWKRELAILPT